MAKVVTLTFLLSRLFQLALYFLSGSGTSVLWNNSFFQIFDHYQLGLLLFIISFFTNKHKNILMGVGAGLIIDEANQVLNILSQGLIPYDFNSPLDYLLSLASLLTFLLLLRGWKSSRGKISL